MAIIRVTLFFELRGYGWTESYYREGPSIDTGNYFVVSDRLAQKRAKMLGAQGLLKYLRWSEEGVQRDSLGITYPAGGLPGTLSEPAGAPQLALLTRMRNPTARKLKLTYLRGIWDSVSKDGGAYSPSTAFTAYFDDWKASLIQDSWGWVGATTTTKADVTAVVANANGSVNVTVESPLFSGVYPFNTTVRLSGVQGARQINGVQSVKALTATTFVTNKAIAIFPYTLGGRATWNQKAFIPIGVVAPSRIVERRPGRPSYLSAGRRTA